MTRMAHIAESACFGLWAALIAFLAFSILGMSWLAVAPASLAWVSATVCWLLLTRREDWVPMPRLVGIGALATIGAPMIMGIAAQLWSSPSRALGLLAYAGLIGGAFTPLGIVGTIIFGQFTHRWRTKREQLHWRLRSPTYESRHPGES
jgi:hypothetical protein